MLRQVMNKLRGEHDKQMDAEEFLAIFEAGKLEEVSKLLAQPKEEFERVLEKKFDMEFEKPEEELPDIPKKPKSKLGQVYQLGKHRVMCGDATKDSILTDEPKLTFTDPPFNIDYSGIKQDHKKIKNDKLDADDFESYLLSALTNIPETFYVCCNFKS